MQKLILKYSREFLILKEDDFIQFKIFTSYTFNTSCNDNESSHSCLQ